MTRNILSILTLLLCFHTVFPASFASAQSVGNFDAVVALGTVRLNEHYAEGVFRKHDSVVRTFRDTLLSGALPIGFTMVDVDTSGSGWTIWYDFNRNSRGQPELVRVFAQKAIPAGEAGSFKKYASWIETVLTRSLGTRKDIDGKQVRWLWKPVDGYFLTAAHLRDADQTWYRIIRLRHGE